MPRRVEEFKAWRSRRERLRPSREEVELMHQLRCLADQRRRRTVMVNKSERERIEREEAARAETRRIAERERRRELAQTSSILFGIKTRNTGVGGAESLLYDTTIIDSSTGTVVYSPNRSRLLNKQNDDDEDEDDTQNTSSSSARFQLPRGQKRKASSHKNDSTSAVVVAVSTFEHLPFDVKARVFEFLPVIPPHMNDDLRFICTLLPTDDALPLYQPHIAREVFDFVDKCIVEHKEQYAQAAVVAIVIGLSDLCLKDAWKYEAGAAIINESNELNMLNANSSSSSSSKLKGVAAPSSQLLQHQQQAALRRRASMSLGASASKMAAATANLEKRKSDLKSLKQQAHHQHQQQHQQQRSIQNSNHDLSQGLDSLTLTSSTGKEEQELEQEENNNNNNYGNSNSSGNKNDRENDSDRYRCSVPHQQREVYGQMISVACSELTRQRKILDLCEKWIRFEKIAVETPCSILRLVLRECITSWTRRLQLDETELREQERTEQEHKKSIQEHERNTLMMNAGGSRDVNSKNKAFSVTGTNSLKSADKSAMTMTMMTSSSSTEPSLNQNRIPASFINPTVRELLQADIDCMRRRIKAVEFVGAPTTEAEDIRDMLWEARGHHLPQNTNRDYGKTLTLGQIVSLGIADVPWVRGFAWQDHTRCVVSKGDVDITKMMSVFPELESMRELSLEKVIDTQRVINARIAEERRIQAEERQAAEHAKAMRVKKTAVDALGRRVWMPNGQPHPFGSCEICCSIHIHQIGLKKPGAAVLGDIAVCERCYEEAFEGTPTIHKLYDWCAVSDVVGRRETEGADEDEEEFEEEEEE